MTTPDTSPPPEPGGEAAPSATLAAFIDWRIDEELFAEEGLDTPYRRAYLIAKTAHAGQTDKAGRDYFTAHVLPVKDRAVFLAPYYLKEQVAIVALLHDVVEDTTVTLDDIEREFGADVREDVDAVSHRSYGLHRNGSTKWEAYQDLIARAIARPVSTVVKLADNRVNWEGLGAITDPATKDRLGKKYGKAYKRLWPAYQARFAQQPDRVEYEWENSETGDRR